MKIYKVGYETLVKFQNKNHIKIKNPNRIISSTLISNKMNLGYENYTFYKQICSRLLDTKAFVHETIMQISTSI